jgi:hypothetical protein
MKEAVHLHFQYFHKWNWWQMEQASPNHDSDLLKLGLLKVFRLL